MQAPYSVPTRLGTIQQVIQKSRLACSIEPARSRQMAISAMIEVRREHPSHVSWAYSAGPPDSSEPGIIDDGAFHGTATKPVPVSVPLQTGRP